MPATTRAYADSLTRFPDEATGAGFGGLLYWLGRASLVGFPPVNFLLGAALLLGVALALRGGVAGWAAPPLVFGAALLRLAVWRAARRDWVTFTARPTQPARPAERLVPRDKLPVHVTGCLEVSGRVSRFAMLPGYYRTFATREHALLCLSRRGRLFTGYPDSEAGLWYAFFHPKAIRSLQRGELRYGRLQRPALALTVEAGTTRVRRRAVEKLYLAADDTVLDRIEADLAADLAADRLPRPHAAPPAPHAHS